MRSKNQVPVQVILPQSQMSSNHAAPRGGFEEALQSSIEASLRTSGAAPSLHIFSSLYHQSKPQQNSIEDRSRVSILPPPDNGDTILDVKPDITDLNRELARQNRPADDQGSTGEPSTPSQRTPSTHSTSSPRDQQNEVGAGNYPPTARGPPPLLMPQSFLRAPPVTSNSNDVTAQANNGNRHLLQRLPSILPGNLQQIEQLKKAQEQVKQLQQIQKWRLLHQHHQQQARAAVANSLSMPRLPFLNPLVPPSSINRNAFAKAGPGVNGVQENTNSTSQTSPGSPMFRKGYCKGGKDIRLSTLQQDGTQISPYPSEYTLVAMSISPSLPQVKISGGYHPPDIPAEGMVVVAIHSKSIPPHQQDPTRPVLAQCIGCGDATLVSFATLSSHINLRSATPAHVNIGLSGSSLLQRHARNFVLRDKTPPHGCVRGAVIPWPTSDITPPRDPTASRLPMLPSAGAPQRPKSGVLPPTSGRLGMKFNLEQQGDRNVASSQQSRSLVLPPDGVTITHQDFMMRSQPTTSDSLQVSLINTSANGSVMEQKFQRNWSPISSEGSPASRGAPFPDFGSNRDWNSTVELPKSFPEYVGLPLILICWEWQQLQSNIHNIHITRSFIKCFQEAMTKCHNSAFNPLSKEICCFIMAQYLASLDKHQFPIPSCLSAWLGRAVFMLASIPQIQLDGNNVINLIRLIVGNCQEKIGLVISQKSQAHAINECIAKLKPDGPSCHIIAHVNSGTILDLSVLLTGTTSRHAREFLQSANDYADVIQRNCTSEVFDQIDNKLNVPRLQSVLTAFSSDLGSPSASFVPTVNSIRGDFLSTSNILFNSSHNKINKFPSEETPQAPLSTTSGFTDKRSMISISDENNNAAIPLSLDDQTIATNVSEKLFSHVSSLCTDPSKLDLSRFSSIQCYFILPPSHVASTEAIADISASGLLQEIGNVPPSSKTTVTRNIVISTALKSKQRFHSMCERIKHDSSTLFILFCMDAHIHCDTNSLDAEWMAMITNIMTQHRNSLLVYCTYIPHALLNQNTSIPFENIVFCESTSESQPHHCLSSKEFTRCVTTDPHHESESVSISDSLTSIHSALIKARVLSSDYIASLGLFIANSRSISKQSAKRDILRRCSSPLTYSVIRDFLSSTEGSTLLVRVPCEDLALRVAEDLKDAREKLNMQNAFEIMLYASHRKPNLSGYFLHTVKTCKGKTDDWLPESLAEIDCIPLVLIYTGRDIINHVLPSNLTCVDLRLVGASEDTLTQSSLLAEMSLVRSSSQIIVVESSRKEQKRTDYEPEVKKARSDSDDDALCMDTFSDDSFTDKDDQLKWRSFQQKDSESLKQQSPDGGSDKSCEYTNKRKRAPSTENGSYQSTEKLRTSSTVIVSRELYPFIESYIKGTQAFRDLPPHRYSEWIHGRTVIAGKLDKQQNAAYLRKWSRPLPQHPDFESNSSDDDELNKGTRTVLLVTSPQTKSVFSCCLFAKQLNRSLMKLLQVEVYDYVSSAVVKPCYPLPNSDLLPQWPVYTTILEMDFDTSIENAGITKASKIMNKQTSISDNFNWNGEPQKMPCMIGKYPALDRSHQECNLCRSQDKDTQIVTSYEMAIPSCGVNENFVVDGTRKFQVTFAIPQASKHQFIFTQQESITPTVRALNLCHKDQSEWKTPVFSLGLSGVYSGLYNLDHTMRNAEIGDQDSPNTNGLPSADLIHVIVVRHKDAEQYKIAWPNKILMILPENFNDLAAGAMKYAIQCVMHQSVSVKQEQNNALLGYSDASDVWPFALILDDTVVMWTASTSNEKSESSEDAASVSVRKNISLVDVLEKIESLPCVERYAAIGFQRFSTQISNVKSEVDLSGELLGSGFSKCHLTSCFALNTVSTKDELFDYTKFLHEDVDWCTRIAAADMAILRFNDISFANKVICPPQQTKFEATSEKSPQNLVCLADGNYNPIPKHPHQLLEMFLCELGHTVFPKAKGNSRHPVLVVDRYISLGPEVFVEFASSKPGALPWATDFEKTYSGLLLYCQSADISVNFLQQFKFVAGSTVCVVGRDRSSLRQTVVNLHLENDWHFRLTDEYQTANDTSKQRPLYYLTGVSRTSR